MNKNGMTDVGTPTHRLDEKVDALKDSVKGIVDQGAQKAEAIKTKVVEVKDRALDRGSDALEQLTSLIKAHPFKAVAIAFGAGYIGMRLFRR